VIIASGSSRVREFLLAFSTVNGQIINSNSQPFVAGGINVMEGQQPDIGTLQSDFPGINFVRLAVYDYASPDALASYVNSLTSAGIVVELEDHNNGGSNSGGGQGQIFSGSQLSDELNWFSSVATGFKDNPNVWFGTNNEPSSTDASGNSNPAALSAWQQQTYQAVRDTGNNNPILLEANSGGAGQTNVGYDAAAYAGMHNVVWDVHFYGWLSGYSTDQSTVFNTLSGIASDTHAIQSADGQIPIIVGEYGNSTNGSTIDGNADQVINAVQQSGMGYAAWAWGAGYPGDGLSNGGNGLSGYGQQVAAGIASGAATSPPAPAPAPTPAPMPMAVGTIPSTPSTIQIDATMLQKPDMQLALLYQSALGRLPDTAGLGFWKNDLNFESLAQIANDFANSPEFAARYGAPDNGSFVTLMYQNTLNRAPDQGGHDFWTGNMNAGLIDRSGTLVGFAETPENLQLHGPAIVQGGFMNV
jgi:cellulase (glycosyl hydrolase family 5)/uncharacterized protein DUF4214